MKAVDGDHIYQDGRHYDCFFGSASVSFWLEMVKQSGGPVLELGCGTGKISIPIAEAGYDVVGIDISESMLACAREKIEDKALNLRLIHADMTKFSLNEKFSLIMLPSNNLCHLHTMTEVETCLQNVADHLADEGLLVIDVFVPDLDLLNQDPEQESTLAEYDDPDGRGKVVVTSTSIYEANTQISRIITHKRIPGCEESTGSLDLKMYFPQELETILHYNGFVIEVKFGDYTKEPFSECSGKQIIVARKA